MSPMSMSYLTTVNPHVSTLVYYFHIYFPIVSMFMALFLLRNWLPEVIAKDSKGYKLVQALANGLHIIPKMKILSNWVLNLSLPGGYRRLQDNADLDVDVDANQESIELARTIARHEMETHVENATGSCSEQGTVDLIADSIISRQNLLDLTMRRTTIHQRQQEQDPFDISADLGLSDRVLRPLVDQLVEWIMKMTGNDEKDEYALGGWRRDLVYRKGSNPQSTEI